MGFQQIKGGDAKPAYSVTPGLQSLKFLLVAVILLPVIILSGCSGLVTANSTQPPPSTFSISGTISAAGGNGATVTLSGAANATATANSSGVFTFTGLSNGTYTVTPGRAGYTFSPSSQSGTVSGANLTGINFAATAQTNTYTLSGTISPTAGGNGATVTLSGAATATTTANSLGVYTFTGLSNGTYAVTPSHTGYTFSPTSQSATVSGANVTGINFTSTAQTGTFSISGTITPSAGGSGATVTLSGAAAAVTNTNSSGIYSFTGLSNGAYTVTPANIGFTFNPASLNVTVSGGNQTAANFTATALVTHTVALNWTPSVTTTVTGYNVYRTTTSGSNYTRINSMPVTLMAYTDTSVQNTTTYYYVTTSVDSTGLESANSNEVPAVIP